MLTKERRKDKEGINRAREDRIFERKSKREKIQCAM
jgi:hypothetical protein